MGKGLSGLVGFFFTFAGVSKTGSAVGIQTVMSDEMQTPFRTGVWSTIFGLPDLPFLYAVGSTELVTGLGMLGYVIGVTSPQVAQWCAAIAAFITFNATSAHVVKGDPMANVAFCGTLCTLYTTLNFLIATSRGKSKN